MNYQERIRKNRIRKNKKRAKNMRGISESSVVRYNDRGIACIPNDAPLTNEEIESIEKYGYINYIPLNY